MRRALSSVTAAIAASTASSPNFLAVRATPSLSSFAVCDVCGSPFRARSAMILARSLREKPVNVSPGSEIEPHRHAELSHMLLDLPDRKGGEVEDGRGEHRRGMPFGNAGDKMVELP